jgi:hypothetical protein
VAICDVDRKTLEEAQAKYPNAKLFESFREMFEVMGDKIDMVHRLHPRPRALPRRDGGHQARQARLRAEATREPHLGSQ